MIMNCGRTFAVIRNYFTISNCSKRWIKCSTLYKKLDKKVLKNLFEVYPDLKDKLQLDYNNAKLINEFTLKENSPKNILPLLILKNVKTAENIL